MLPLRFCLLAMAMNPILPAPPRPIARLNIKQPPMHHHRALPWIAPAFSLTILLPNDSAA